jgi:hypothetical protein
VKRRHIIIACIGRDEFPPFQSEWLDPKKQPANIQTYIIMILANFAED